VKSSVAAHLGYDPFTPDAARIVTVSLTHEGAGLKAQVDLRDSAFNVVGTRTLITTKDDCSELVSSMALAISIAVDPVLALSRPEGAPSVAQAALPPPDATVQLAAGGREPAQGAEPQPHASPAPAPPLPLRLRMTLTGGAAFGVTPGAAFLPSLGFGVGVGRFSLDLEGAALASSAEGGGNASVLASLILARAAPCFHWAVAMGCGLLGVGSMSGAGVGVDEPAQAATFYSDAGARAGFEVPVSDNVSLRAAVDLLAPLVKTTLLLRGTPVWSTPSVTGAVFAGVLAHFP
jgi:hypothetical protein